MEKTNVILYIALSMDGFIARPDGAVDWLDNVEGEGDNGYGDFYNKVGTVVMGRNTYEEVLKLTEEFPYAGKPCYILTRSPIEDNGDVHFTDEDLVNLISRLQESSEGYIWLVGGGQLIKQFLTNDLIDEIELYIIPKLIGEGIRLFPDGTPSADFELIETGRCGQIATLKYKLKSL